MKTKHYEKAMAEFRLLFPYVKENQLESSLCRFLEYLRVVYEVYKPEGMGTDLGKLEKIATAGNPVNSSRA